MMTRTRQVTAALTLFAMALGTSPLLAHYLWVTIDAKQGEHGTANLYFEGGPGAGDGHYLDHFTETGKTWIRTVEEPKPQAIKTHEATAKDKRWLAVELPTGGPRSIDSYGKFGVYAYGKTNVLLHYYARNLDVTSHEDLHELARSEQLALDIVPHDEGKAMELQVLFDGKPAADSSIKLRGPKKFQVNLKTDKSGRVRFDVEHEGTYTFHAMVEEDKAGTDGGEKYTLVRHHSTMLLKLPLEK
jgi:uncharacterized GH25 family protein